MSAAPDTLDALSRSGGRDPLQDYYIISRDGEQVSVWVHDLSDEEIEAKAREYEAMSRACFENARELRRFAEVRAGQRLFAAPPCA